MLKPVSKKSVKSTGGKFAIIASRFNAQYVDAMLRAAKRELEAAEAEAIEVIRVPGAFEIPVIVGYLAHLEPCPYDAIICFGVIFRGETTHAQHIGEAVSQAVAALQIQRPTPIIHGVYLFENQEQARVRCLDPKHNRGIELAHTALEMASLMKQLKARS